MQQILVPLLLLFLGCAHCSPAPDYLDYQADVDTEYEDYDSETLENEEVTDVSDAQILTEPQSFTVVLGDTVKLPCQTKSSSGKMSNEPFTLMTDKYLHCRSYEDMAH